MTGIVLLRIEGGGEAFQSLSKRAQDRVSREAHLAVGVYWDREYKMRHLGPGAAERYGYKERTDKYLRKKEYGSRATWKIKGGRNDSMIFSGQTLQAVKQRQVPRAFPSRVTILMPAPSYIQMRPKPGKRDAPNLGEELTRTIPEEQDRLLEVWVESAERSLQEELDRT